MRVRVNPSSLAISGIKEVYNGQPDKRVIDYIALYSGTWKSDFQKL